jgi:hypothetical protein
VYATTVLFDCLRTVELEDFPFDVQDLTVSLAFNTRTKGMMPLEIVNAPTIRTGIVAEGFVDGKMWNRA